MIGAGHASIGRWRLIRHSFVALASLAVAFAATPSRADLPYATKIVGTDDKQLLAELNAVSQLVTLEEKPPESDQALRRRAEEDLPRLKPVLELQGYWAGTIDFSIDTKVRPAQVTLKVDPGPRYRLKEVSLVTPEGNPPPDIALLDPSVFGLKLGDPAKSSPVLDAEAKITSEYGRRGRPFAKVLKHRVIIDHGTRTMSVNYTVDPGPRAKFGPTTIAGLTSLGQDYVEHRVSWHRGEDYDDRLVEATRKLLIDSALFSTVRIDHAAQLDAVGEVPMNIAVVERPPRSLGAGLSYNTSEGFGANGFWEHRNLFGEGEKLRLDVDIAQQRRDLIANFRKPDLLGDKDQDFTTLAEIVDENPIAYTARRELVSPGVERRFAGAYTAGAGLQLQHATVTEAARDITDTYTLLGTPLFLRRDTRDDPLNPQQGSREALILTPNTSVSGQSLTFLNARLDASVYQRLGESDRYVAAAFLGVG